ncbi:MAG: class 1 fructose-bisphosphatase, partial [Neisseriaceae bacterium]|nr:class 1 fructose-bisphosphatase [Neisseriaceae bacterium]
MFCTPLSDFLNQHFQQNNLSGSLKETLFAIINACVAISAKTRQGALSGVLGEAGSGNIQGENQKKLDVIANDILINALRQTPMVAGIASEEEDTFVQTNEHGEYLVLFDPLDGSSNIDVNISVGTIFSVLKKPSSGSLKLDDFLQNGRNQ